MFEPVVDIHPDVLAWDIQEIGNYIAMDDEGAAQRVLDRIDETFQQLAQFPLLGTDIHPMRRTLTGIRMIPVMEYRNYLIYYRPLPGDAGVRILYVLHAARDAATFAREHRRR